MSKVPPERNSSAFTFPALRQMKILNILVGFFIGFIAGIKAAGIEMDRKVMAALAFDEPAAFAALVEKAKAAGAA